MNIARTKNRTVLWADWEQDINATLMFIVRDGKVLLIEKLTGIGKGKVNGPGGKIDPGETAEQGVIRECQEELHINVENPRKMGELWFAMSHIPDIHCHVYTAEAFEGTPTPTKEANPFWSEFDEVPYERMWADDEFWLPQMLAGNKFNARFVFEEETVLWDNIIFGEEATEHWKGYTVR